MDLKRSTDKRRFHRAPFKRPIKLNMVRGDMLAIHVAQDISQGGIRVNVRQFLPLGTHVDVQVQIEDMGRMSELEARVVWVKELPYSEMYQVGIEFMEGAVFHKLKIAQYVAEFEAKSSVNKIKEEPV